MSERERERDRERERHRERNRDKDRDEDYYIRKTYTHAEQEIISQICLDKAEF